MTDPAGLVAIAIIAAAWCVGHLWPAHPAWGHATRRWRTAAIARARHPGGVVTRWPRRRP